MRALALSARRHRPVFAHPGISGSKAAGALRAAEVGHERALAEQRAAHAERLRAVTPVEVARGPGRILADTGNK